MKNDQQITEDDGAKPYHHGDLWRALVEAGIAILHEEGVQALSLRAVARRTGVSHAAPYRHFADKDALIAAIAEDGFRRLNVGLADVLAHADDHVGTLLYQAGHRYVHFVLENPDHVRVMFNGLLKDYEKYPRLCEAADAAFALLVELMQRVRDGGELASGIPYQQGLAAWSIVHGLAMLLLESSFPPKVKELIDIDQMTTFCVDVIARGLAPHQASS